MCGILGTIPSTDIIKFKQGLTNIAHRGPDGQGIWEEENNKITLGHRRLAILDLSERGKQPMEYGDFVITYNGEIFNFLEIKKELQQKGHSFQTESDTEVILAAFREWKEKCLLKFNGMWAFAIWNKKTNSLFLSRDRFGIKPLYYTFTNGIFAFGSEMKALFPFLPQLEVAENFDYLKNNLFSYESTEYCLIKGLKRFPAGSYAYFEPTTQKKLSPIQYWDTKENLVTVPKSYDEQVEIFRELFIDACKIRMRADVPIGTALSGGLDSSATISTMSHISKTRTEMRQAKDWQHAFVATFPDSFLDETYYAKKVTDSLNIKSTFLPIDPVKGIENLGHYLYLFEELYLTSPVPMMDIYKSVRENGVVVSIDGHGADEMMSGYGHIPSAIADCGFRMDKVQNILQLMKGMSEEQQHSQISKNPYTWKWYYEKLNYQAGGGRKNIIKYLVKDMMGKFPKENAQKGQYGALNTELYELFHKTVLPTLLRNYDRYSMASGVEIRMPFMDYRLVTFAFSLPWESKVKNGYSKSILRDALKGILTDEVRLRKSKIGFNTPIVDWLQGAWKEYILDTVHSQDFENAQTINPKEVRTKLIDVINNPNALFQEGEQAWIALMPYLWEKAILKPNLYHAK